MITYNSMDGSKIRILRNKHAEESNALLYLYKFESELKMFVESPEIELTFNRSERAVKMDIIARKSFMFLNTVDSSQAFTDCLTIIANSPKMEYRFTITSYGLLPTCNTA